MPVDVADERQGPDDEEVQAQTIDWIAVYDATSERCYYVPASELGEGRAYLHLRLTPALSGRRLGIRPASDYLSF